MMSELCGAHSRFRGHVNVCEMTAETFSDGGANRYTRQLDTARANVHVIGMQRESISQAGSLLVAVSEIRLSIGDMEAFDNGADDRSMIERSFAIRRGSILPLEVRKPSGAHDATRPNVGRDEN